MRGNSLKFLLLPTALIVALMVAGASSGGQQQKPRMGGTLVFGGTADPVVLDGALVSDGESLRPIRQMFEGLVTLKPGTFKVIPELATKWQSSNRGRTWTFTLRKGVKFHDGTAFNAAAVCFNFDRWYNFKGPFQLANATYYWQKVFRGFRENERPELAPSLYRSCRGVNASTVRINLTGASSQFLPALTLPALSFGSPRALRQYEADKGEIRAGSFRAAGSYGFEHPTGTGPYKFESWSIGNRLVLVRNPNYWGKKPYLDRIIFRPIASESARLNALQTGELGGFDHVAPQDMATIRRDRNLKLIDRPQYNVAYVGINQSIPPMDKLAVRQAVAYGLDRASVVRSFYAGRGVVAHEFMPPQLWGYAKDVTKYTYNPERAKQLLRRAGLTLPVRIEFWYPTGVTRPYMPDPKRNFEAFAASLEKSGFEVVARSAPWRPDYLGNCQTGKCQLYLLGWTGDFGHPHNFIGTFFAKQDPAWGFNNAKIFNLLKKGEAEADLTKAAKIYQQANRELMKFLPGVPYAHTKPGLGFRRNYRGYIASPVSLEPFSLVHIGGT